MYRLQRIAILVLVSSLILTLLAGCGGTNTGAAASGSAVTAQTQTAAPAGTTPAAIHRKLTVGCLWPFNDPSSKTPMRAMYMITQDYMKANPGTDIEFQLISTDYVQYEQQMKVLAASNSLPDIFQYQVNTSMQDPVRQRLHN